MGLHKADISIGQRAAAEILDKALDKPVSSIMNAIGIRRQCWNEWNEGVCPATFALQKLALAGFDVQYILTGKRTAKEAVVQLKPVLIVPGMQEITEAAGFEIITKREPLGRFYFLMGNRWIGIDNRSGDCWVECFGTMVECVTWLMRKDE